MTSLKVCYLMILTNVACRHCTHLPTKETQLTLLLRNVALLDITIRNKLDDLLGILFSQYSDPLSFMVVIRYINIFNPSSTIYLELHLLSLEALCIPRTIFICFSVFLLYLDSMLSMAGWKQSRNLETGLVSFQFSGLPRGNLDIMV